MKGSRRAFSLPELLVVLAILVILAGTLVPVFNLARNAAKATGCISNFRQTYFATRLYLSDYDDVFMPVNYQPAGNNQDSRYDRTWVQLILPYAPDFEIFRGPADDSDRPRRESTFDEDLIPGDLYSQYYTASLRTNVGFNFIYFSPIYDIGDQWISQPNSDGAVESPDQTFLFVDSVWSLDSNGDPSGGGSWLVVPPCRYDVGGYDTFAADPAIKDVFTNKADGWEVGKTGSPLQYGFAWPWHSGGTRLTTVTDSGSAREVTLTQLESGCDVQSNWTGRINQISKYEWDLR